MNKFITHHQHNTDLVLTKHNVNFSSKKFKATLTARGLVEFAEHHSRKDPVCPHTINNFMTACNAKIQEVQHENKHLANKTIADLKEMPIFGLYERLTAVDNRLAEDFVNHSELQRLLRSVDVFYIMQLEDAPSGKPVFRGGASCLQEFRARLAQHDTYKSVQFKKFQSIYILKSSEHLDSMTLENNFFMRASLILNKPKIDIKNGNGKTGVEFESVEIVDEIFNECLKNPLINYDGLVERFTNKEALHRLDKKLWKSLKFSFTVNKIKKRFFSFAFLIKLVV